MVAVEVGDPFLQLVAALALTDAQLEQVYVGIQRELVHGVHAAQVVQDGEEDGSSLGTRPVALLKERAPFNTSSTSDSPKPAGMSVRPLWQSQSWSPSAHWSPAAV